jgi:hypothetical protein
VSKWKTQGPTDLVCVWCSGAISGPNFDAYVEKYNVNILVNNVTCHDYSKSKRQPTALPVQCLASRDRRPSTLPGYVPEPTEILPWGPLPTVAEVRTWGIAALPCNDN